MVVAVQSELAAHVQQLTPIDDEPVARSPAAERTERPFDLISVRLDDCTRIADILLLGKTADERPPDLAVERLRIHAKLIVDAIKITLGDRRREVVQNKELHADHGIDRVRPTVRHQCGIDAEVRLVVALHAVVCIDVPVAERLLPEKRCPIDTRDVSRRIRSQRDRICLRCERQPLTKAEILAADEEIRMNVDAIHIRDRAQLCDAKVRKRRCIDGTLLH